MNLLSIEHEEVLRFTLVNKPELWSFWCQVCLVSSGTIEAHDITGFTVHIILANFGIGAEGCISSCESWEVNASVVAATNSSVDWGCFDYTNLHIKRSSAKTDIVKLNITPYIRVELLRKRCVNVNVVRIEGNMAFHSVVVLDSPLIRGKALAKTSAFIFNVKLDTLVCDAEELEDTFVMGDPRSEGHPVSAEDDIALVRGDVIECYGVWLDSTSSHFPNLIAACSVEEMLVMSSVWHRHC